MTDPETISEQEELALPVVCCTPAAVPLLAADEAERLAHVLKALGHPIRVQLMHLLGQLGGQVCVCEIEPHFDVKQPTVSHHLRTLREAGLIEAEQRGLYAYYRIRPDAWSFFQAQLGRLGR